MKESLWGYWIIVLGIFIIFVLLLVQNVTTSNTQDYYLLKSVTQSAMLDSVDLAYYRTYGEIKINKEKFYENFLIRFSNEVDGASGYKIKFFDIYEAPPKVSVLITSKSDSFRITGDSEEFDIINKIDAILETK